VDKRLEIISQINKDLKIQRYSNEADTDYIARVIYSALSMWIRHSILDKDILIDSEKDHGVSKIHILNRCSFFLKKMLSLFPECNNWFYPDEIEGNPVVIVRDRLNNSGELLDIGYETNLGLPKYEESVIAMGLNVVRGLSNNGYTHITGLAQLKVTDIWPNTDMEEISNFYGMPNMDAQEVLQNYLYRIRWSHQNITSGQMFDRYSSKSFSNSWIDEIWLKDRDISLYKIGIYDFGFIKFEGGEYYLSQIDNYLIEKREVRRFMYGMKARVNNPVKASYRKHAEAHLIELNLYNALPSLEKTLLLLLGWPKGNIKDYYNFLFDDAVWAFVTVVLERLHIKLEEII
jgi:hypothetical protein